MFKMKKQTIKYDSPVDSLVAVSKRLSVYEDKYKRSSEDFYNDFNKGVLDDSEEFIEWSNDYQHFLVIKESIQTRPQHVA